MNAQENLQVLMENMPFDFAQCLMAVQLIGEADEAEQPALLMHFLQEHPKKSAEEAAFTAPIPLSDEEVEELTEKHSEAMEEQVNLLLKLYWHGDGAHPQKLYAQMWQYICGRETVGLKALALQVMAKDPRLGIRLQQALRMTQKEYIAAIKALGDDAKDHLLLLMVTPWNQKTERASMLLDLLDKYEERNLRVVLLSRILAHYEMVLRMEALKEKYGADDDDEDEE